MRRPNHDQVSPSPSSLAAREPSVTVRAPAKINLHLSVGPPREDGFHDLRTVYQAVSLHDEVTATPADKLAISVEGEGASFVPVDRRNLAARAALALAERAGVEPAVRLRIRKRIPVAAGLAGGSADAAAALVACDRLWGTALGQRELLALAAELGSDVPFALTGGSVLGTGRGEVLTPVLSRGHQHWVLAFADGRGLSTPAVYAEVDRLRGDELAHPVPGSADSVIAALLSDDPTRLAPELGNDMTRAALSLRPALRRTLDAGLELDALAAMISGSGPTCAFLTSSADEAVKLAAALGAEGVCRAVRTVTGPAEGAKVVPLAEVPGPGSTAPTASGRRDH